MPDTVKIFTEEFKAGDKVYFGKDILKVVEVKPYPGRNWITLVVSHPLQDEYVGEFSFDRYQPLDKVV